MPLRGRPPHQFESCSVSRSTSSECRALARGGEEPAGGAEGRWSRQGMAPPRDALRQGGRSCSTRPPGGVGPRL